MSYHTQHYLFSYCIITMTPPSPIGLIFKTPILPLQPLYCDLFNSPLNFLPQLSFNTTSIPLVQASQLAPSPTAPTSTVEPPQSKKKKKKTSKRNHQFQTIFGEHFLPLPQSRRRQREVIKLSFKEIEGSNFFAMAQSKSNELLTWVVQTIKLLNLLISKDISPIEVLTQCDPPQLVGDQPSLKTLVLSAYTRLPSYQSS